MNNKQKTINKKKLADFLFETATLKRLQRTGWQILGSGNESIAEHSYMITVISFLLTEGLNVNREKVLVMALFHDLEETRTGDVYRLADFYVKVDKKRAVRDAFAGLLNEAGLIKIAHEYETKKTLESQIVHDADTLALCIELKILVEKGDNHAREWLSGNKDKLFLEQSKKLLEGILKTDSQNWWKKEREKLHKIK